MWSSRRASGPTPKKSSCGIVLPPRVGAERQPAVRRDPACRTVPSTAQYFLSEPAAQTVERAFSIEQPAIAVAGAIRETAARGETAELQMEAVTSERATATRVFGEVASRARARSAGTASVPSAFPRARASELRRGSGLVLVKSERTVQTASRARWQDSRRRRNQSDAPYWRTHCIQDRGRSQTGPFLSCVSSVAHGS